MLVGKITGTRNFLLCRCPKAIANNRRRHTRGERTGFATRRKSGTQPTAASWQVQNPGDFLAWHFPKPVFLEAAPLLVSFEVLHTKKLPEDRI
jgi:hypothetical protein